MEQVDAAVAAAKQTNASGHQKAKTGIVAGFFCSNIVLDLPETVYWLGRGTGKYPAQPCARPRRPASPFFSFPAKSIEPESRPVNPVKQKPP
ncbi:MAG: hypothetical protein JSR65_02980 [Proteobacteria bacterium]|nr:hypothetical protein [Pseudomonadota bacterium]